MTPTDELEKAAREYSVSEIRQIDRVLLNSNNQNDIEASLAGAKYQDSISREAGRAEVLELLRSGRFYAENQYTWTLDDLADWLEAKLTEQK